MNLLNKTRHFLLKKLKKIGYIYPERMNYKRLLRYLYLKEMFDLIENVPGSIVECGVAYGDSLIAFTSMARHENKGRKVFGLDSFQGFPKYSQFDKSKIDNTVDTFRECNTTLITKQLKRAGLGDYYPTLVPGFFEDSIPRWKKSGTMPEKIALLHLDVDLYDSYVTTLNYLYPLVVSGGIVLFDEYNLEKWPGGTKAINEFIQKYKLPLIKSKYENRVHVVKP